MVSGTQTTVHCYSLPLDGNGRVRFKPLAEYLRDRIVDYAIPAKSRLAAIKQVNESKSVAPMVKLTEEARRLFVNLEKTGEGGELLLFALAEGAFGLAQVLCKMSLKTSTSVHYHGADGVFAQGSATGDLKLYWGESKLYGDVKDGIAQCLTSLAPFLLEPEGQDAKKKQDLFLVTEFANLADDNLVEGLKRFFDQDDPASLRMKHCGIALVGFDCSAYPNGTDTGVLEEIEAALNELLPQWEAEVSKRVGEQKLSNFDIHFLCVPLQSVAEFRAYFLELLGKSE